MPTRGLSLHEKLDFYLPDRGDGCWLWTGTLDHYGYGKTHHLGHQDLAHRVAYRRWVGPIPDGMTIDHECHNEAVRNGTCKGGNGCPHRRCCNPVHLLPKTGPLNTQDARSGRALPPACRKGHLYTPENLHIGPRGNRVCRACRAEYAREWRGRLGV